MATTKTQPLTRQLSQASAVGTEVAQTNVSNLGQVTGKFLADAVTTVDVGIGRSAAAAVDAAVEEVDDFANTKSIEDAIDTDLSDMNRKQKGVRQGTVSKDRFITEMDARVRKIKARFPGHTDVIDQRARRLLGYDPRQATRDIALSQGVQNAKFQDQLITAAVARGMPVYVNNDPSLGIDRERSAMVGQQVLLAEQKLKVAKEAQASLRVSGGGGTGALTLSQQNLYKSVRDGTDQRMNFVSDFVASIPNLNTAPEEVRIAVVNLAKDMKADALRALTAPTESGAVLDTSDIKAVMERIDQDYAWIEASLGLDVDTFDSFDATAKWAKSLESAGKIVILEDMAKTNQLVQVLGRDAGAMFGSILLNSEMRTKIQNTIEREVASILTSDGTVANMSELVNARVQIIQDIILSGQYKANSPHLRPDQREVIAEDAWEAAKGFGKIVVPEQGISTWGNTWEALNDTYIEHLQSDPDNITNLVKAVQSPTFFTNLTTLEKTNPSQAQSVKDFTANLVGDHIIDLLEPERGLLRFTVTNKVQLPTSVFFDEATQSLMRRSASGGVIDPSSTPSRQEARAASQQQALESERFVTPVARAAVAVRGLFQAPDRPLDQFRLPVDDRLVEANRLASLLENKLGVSKSQTFGRIFSSIDIEGSERLAPPPVVETVVKPTSTLAVALEQDEGRRTEVYLDSQGIPTVGVGHKILPEDPEAALKVGDSISEDRVNELFAQDLEKHRNEAKAVVPDLEGHPQGVQEALVNMAFNLGRAGLAEFGGMLEAIQQRDYDKAAKEALDSKWAKQVGKRATRIAKQFKDSASNTDHNTDHKDKKKNTDHKR